MKPWNHSGVSKSLYILSVVAWILCAFATIFHEKLWGIHFLAFLPGYAKMILLLLSGFLIIFPHLFIDPLKRYTPGLTFSLIIMITVVLGAYFYFFPIVDDNYGDAMFVREIQDDAIGEIATDLMDAVQNFSLMPAKARVFMVGGIEYLAKVFGTTRYNMYRIFGLIFGIAWIMLWLFYIRSYVDDKAWGTTLAIIGCTIPMTAAFHCHLETYAPIYFFHLLWYILLVEYFKSGRKGVFLFMMFLTVVIMRMHPTGWFFLPLLGLMALDRLKYRFQSVRKVLSWKGLAYFLWMPALLAGIIAYFFITGDYNDERLLHREHVHDHIFLPIISPPAPYDQYNLQSFNHIFDFLNSMLFWTIPGWVLFLYLVGKKDNRKLFHKTDFLILMNGILLLVVFLFVINPILTMPLDWDLYTLPVSAFLVLITLIVRHCKDRVNPYHVLIISIAFSFFSLSFSLVNSQREMYSKRLESIGTHVFKTYYEWSGRQIEFAIHVGEYDLEDQLGRYEHITNKLRAEVRKRKTTDDKNFAGLLNEYGKRLSLMALYNDAETIFAEGTTYDRGNKNLMLGLLEAQFRQGNYTRAYATALQLLEKELPSRQKALRMVIHCAIEADKREEAILYAESFLTMWPEDQFIQRISQGLLGGLSLEELRDMYSKG